VARLSGALEGQARQLCFGNDPRSLHAYSVNALQFGFFRALEQRFGRAPSESEIAREMGLSLTDYQQLLGNPSSTPFARFR